MVVEIRDWCQNVGEYNTYNFCIWHFGLCVIVSKIERCRSSDPPYEIAINPWWRGGRGLPSLIALLLFEMCLCTKIVEFYLSSQQSRHPPPRLHWYICICLKCYIFCCNKGKQSCHSIHASLYCYFRWAIIICCVFKAQETHRPYKMTPCKNH